MSADAKVVKELRERTSVSVMECKKALEACDNNLEKAVEWLKRRGADMADKKAGRTANDGRIASYIHHNGKLGVLLELNCESDFVGKTPDFQQLAQDICLQIAAMRPQFVSREEVSATLLEEMRAMYAKEVEGKPAEIAAKITEGKLEKNFYSVQCLLDQPFVKDPSGKQTIGALVKDVIARLGENIVVRRFARFEVGK